MPKIHSLRDAYRYLGFVPAMTVRVEPDAPADYVLLLTRRQKKVCGLCGLSLRGSYDHVRHLDCAGHPVLLEFDFRRVDCPQCGVKRERLAANPRYTRRFVLAVGRRCRTATITDVAAEMDLHWYTVKEIDKFYMREQLDLAGPPAPTVNGVDEISIGPGHSYRIVVSDLIRRRAIWFGGTDRSEALDAPLLRCDRHGNVGRHPAGRHGHVEGFPQLRRRSFKTSSSSSGISTTPSTRSEKANTAG